MESKLLVLDLDETLIYATEDKLGIPHNATVGNYFVYNRPHVKEFLEFCLNEFAVAIWTSSTENYADDIVKHLLGGPDNLEFCWARNRCTLTFDHDDRLPLYVKNLKKVKRLGFNLEKILVVDDTPQKWAHQYGNLIRVTPFEGDKDDSEMHKLIPFLKYLKGVANVRKVEKRGWQSRQNWSFR